MDNLIVGILLVILGIGIIFIGNWYGKKISPYHIVIYFMASFVIFTGVLFLFLFDKPSVF